jgi:hypothetical protein
MALECQRGIQAMTRSVAAMWGKWGGGLGLLQEV